MSIQAVAWVLEASQSRSFDRLVLISIANYAHKDGGGSCPSVKTIADEAGVSERQVRYSVSNLVKMGELSVQYKTTRYGTNVFTLEKMHSASPASRAPLNSVEPGTRGAPEGHQRGTPVPPILNTSLEPGKPRAQTARAFSIPDHKKRIEAKHNRIAQEVNSRIEANVGSREPVRLPRSLKECDPELAREILSLAARKRMPA